MQGVGNCFEANDIKAKPVKCKKSGAQTSNDCVDIGQNVTDFWRKNTRTNVGFSGVFTVH
jgi:hypothetical protein